ncbi:glycosyltransferase [Maribacter sp. TH_r10]|uniref:glycosyltransferase n=1 Tax=Maribacter sp. TH_r10 TaxID=3082086 RepID=UPI00295491F9|nr:glycosyltransferase [Maribacter sp. TH_r10]MDV7137580.1 glycosyltransferase [Maribacter sp. TH_r10]
MKKIKVLHISEPFAAGVYNYIKDLCRFCDTEKDIESYVTYSGKREDTNKENFEHDFSPNTTLVEVDMEREISPINDFLAVYKIIKEIRRIKPDVIHLHSSKAGVLGRIAAKTYPEAKLYYTPHGYSFVREDISEFKKKLFWTIEKNTSRFFGGITIACGDTEYEFAKQIKHNSYLIRNGVDVNEIEKKEKNKRSKGFVIGTIGRISPQKNPYLFNQIALKFPEIEFIWVGDGENKNILTSKNIKVKGWIPREEVLDLINEFNIYIQTSSWEGLPFTIIEAMALKKPIIATNVIGNKDAVKHNYNGILCSNLKEFEKAILKVLEDSSFVEKMGVKSQMRAKKLFNKNSNFKELIKLYKN